MLSFLENFPVVLFLNYIYFAFITVLGVIFLFSVGWSVRSPFDRSQKLRFNGTEMLWVLTFGTGLLAFAAPGAIDLMAIRLLALELLCIIGTIMAKNSIAWSLPLLVYAAYLCWIIVGISYSEYPVYGVRVLLKNIYPLVIMIFASAVVRDREVFIKSLTVARVVAIASIVVAFVPGVSHIMPIFWYSTALAIAYISMMIMSLGLYFHTDEKYKNAILTIVFLIPCFVWVLRTSIMGSAVALMTFFFIKYRLRSLPVVFGVVLLSVLAVFSIPSLHEKMFRADNVTIEEFQDGEISKDDIDSNGRFDMWEWSMDNYYKDNKLIGSGSGMLQEAFYSLRHPFGSIRIVHNDYVQILCDNGLIGITLFLLSFILLITHCFAVYNTKSEDASVRLCAIIAGASAAGVIVTMLSDNVTNYTMATLSYPCGIYGMMLGLKARYRKKL